MIRRLAVAGPKRLAHAVSRNRPEGMTTTVLVVRSLLRLAGDLPAVKEIEKAVPVVVRMEKPEPKKRLEFGTVRNNIRPIPGEEASAAALVRRVYVKNISAIVTPNDALDLGVFHRL